ncbi:MAG: thiamine-phosphate synthase family protein [Chloroflexota bacterium]
MDRQEQRDLVLGNVTRALAMLEDAPEFALMMPEVRVNMVYALPGAISPQDVVAIDGRITAVSGIIRAAGLPRFGASNHMARLMMEVRKYHAEFNAGINFRCDKDVIEVVQQYCMEKGYRFGWIDRTKEPAEVAEKEGGSMPWKVKYLFDTCGGIPRFFYEGDGWGKEPLFVVLGKDAVEATGLALEIARRCREKMPK